MVLYLVKEFSIRVDDVSLQLCENYERTSTMFALKRRQKELMEKRKPCMLVSEEIFKKESKVTDSLVSIDFYRLLQRITTVLAIPVTEIEYLRFETGAFVAWMSVECSEIVAGSQWFESEMCHSAFGARECLSKKVIHALMLMHRFKVIDVNYESLLCLVLRTKLERESSFAIRERVYEIQSDKESNSTEASALPVTPKELKFVIERPLAAPPVPRKRKQPASSDESSRKNQGELIPYSVVAHELNYLACHVHGNNE